VEVGTDSTVDCTSVSTCNVACRGQCKVSCENVSNCQVDCPSSAPERSCADGSIACGSC
jgi:hypothetical protein